MNYVHVTAPTGWMGTFLIVIALPVQSVRPLVRAGVVSFVDGNYFSGVHSNSLLQVPGAFIPSQRTLSR